MPKHIISKFSLDALLITKPENIRYLTGYSGDSSYLLITHDKYYLIAHAIYAAKYQNLKIHIIEPKIGKSALDKLEKLIKVNKIKFLGYENIHLTVSTFASIKRELQTIQFKPLNNHVELLRAVKEPHEIKNIIKASDIAAKVFLKIVEMISPGITEKDIAAEIEYQIRKEGGDRDSFDPIVASGIRSAYPHTIATDKVIVEREYIKMDFGVKYRGYCSDLTRTIVLGKATAKQKKIYNIVKRAQSLALAAVKPGVTGSEIDKIARNVIVRSGFKENFIHSTGHGVGLEIHECPRLGIKSKDILKENMAITIEPGIYVPNFGGVRIEDTILVTKRGSKILTDVPKELEI